MNPAKVEKLTAAHSPIFLIVFFSILIFLIGLVCGYFVGTNQPSSTLNTKLNQTPSPTPSGRKWPQVTSEEKNIKIGKSSPQIGILFNGIENTTYDEITYTYQQIPYTLFDFHLPDKNIMGEGQKIKRESSDNSYLEFIYEGFRLKPLITLRTQLEQTPGYYPTTIYDGAYEIVVNKNNIRMKKQYSTGPGYLEYKVEFTTPTPVDSKYPYRYYSFSTSIPTITDKYNFDTFSKNPMAWVKNNQIPEFMALDTFIQSIVAK